MFNFNVSTERAHDVVVFVFKRHRCCWRCSICNKKCSQNVMSETTKLRNNARPLSLMKFPLFDSVSFFLIPFRLIFIQIYRNILCLFLDASVMLRKSWGGAVNGGARETIKRSILSNSNIIFPFRTYQTPNRRRNIKLSALRTQPMVTIQFQNDLSLKYGK